MKSIYLRNLFLIINKGNNDIKKGNNDIKKGNNYINKGDNKDKNNIPFTIVDFTVKRLHDPNN